MFTKAVVEPRLTAEFATLDDAPVPALQTIGERLSRDYGVRYDSAWLNLYRDENDSTGWHADRPVNRAPVAVVPVLSLGAVRRFLLRPKDGGKSIFLDGYLSEEDRAELLGVVNACPVGRVLGAGAEIRTFVEFSPEAWPQTAPAAPVVLPGDAWWEDALPKPDAD